MYTLTHFSQSHAPQNFQVERDGNYIFTNTFPMNTFYIRLLSGIAMWLIPFQCPTRDNLYFLQYEFHGRAPSCLRKLHFNFLHEKYLCTLRRMEFHCSKTPSVNSPSMLQEIFIVHIFAETISPTIFLHTLLLLWLFSNLSAKWHRMCRRGKLTHIQNFSAECMFSKC